MSVYNLLHCAFRYSSVHLKIVYGKVISVSFIFSSSTIWLHYSLLPLLNTHLLSPYYAPGPVGGSGNTVMNKTSISAWSHYLERDRQYVKQCVRVGCEQPFSVRGQIVNMLGFVGQGSSVPPTQFCPWRVKAAMDSMYMSGYGFVSTKCYLQNQVVGLIWPAARMFADPYVRWQYVLRRK